jgi:hypothetical protein
MSNSAAPPGSSDRSRAPVNVNVHTYPAQLQYPPPTYLVFTVLVTLFGFPPTGIIALVSSMRVNTLWKTGQHDKARKSSRRARNWGLLTLAIWVVVVVVVVFWASSAYLNG